MISYIMWMLGTALCDFHLLLKTIIQTEKSENQKKKNYVGAL